VHFKHLAAPGMSHDTLRVHPLQTILNNLEIDPEYYARSFLQMPVYTHTELHLALDASLNYLNYSTDTSQDSTPNPTQKPSST
jgi:hypothetical protein